MTEPKPDLLSCGDCQVKACSKQSGNHPQFCISAGLSGQDREIAFSLALAEENNRILKAAAEVEADGYQKLCRVEETIAFAKKIDAKKLGIAGCAGLQKEVSILTKILRHHGFEVFAAACKVGEIAKTAIGIEEQYTNTGKIMCNPILQAQLLNQQHTDLNIVVGLCVGHDSMFYKYSQALTTTIVVKDRVLGNNPAAALYLTDSYYRRLLK